MLRVLHTADWHLGRRHGALPPAARHELGRARYEAVERLLALATRMEVDAILCAGDLFDEPEPDPVVTEPLAGALRLQRIPIVLLPGNHDPLGGPKSPWHPDHPFRRALPTSVHVVDRDPFELELAGGVIVASPCRSTAGALAVADRLPPRAPGDERPRIGLAHGSTHSASAPFPVDLDAIAPLGLDFLALGDHHGVAIHEGLPTVAYAGTPEPTRFGERGAGHVVLARVARGAVHCRAERVRRWCWREETIASLAELEAMAETDPRDTVLRLSFALTLTPTEHARAESLLARLERRMDTLVVRREGLRLDLRGDDVPLDALPPLLADAGRALLGDARGGDPIAERALRHLFRLAGQP